MFSPYLSGGDIAHYGKIVPVDAVIRENIVPLQNIIFLLQSEMLNSGEILSLTYTLQEMDWANKWIHIKFGYMLELFWYSIVTA